MQLSIRARLALWSSTATLVILIVASAVFAELHERQAMRQLDEGVNASIQTAASVMRNELDEGLSPGAAAADALAELDPAGSGLAFLTARGVLGVRASGVPALSDSVLVDAADAPETVVSDGAAFRVGSSRFTHGGHSYCATAWRPLAPFEADRAALRRAMALTVPLGVLLATAGGWLIGWRALRPLSDMAAQAGRMSRRRPNERLAFRANRDELSVLGKAFNQVLDQLAGALRDQRSFMTDASHQLRTPLSISRTAAEVTLSQHERTSEEYRDALGVIADQTLRLTRIVDDMFSLALADADARPAHLQQLYLEDLVDAPVRAARVLAESKGVVIHASRHDDCQVAADEKLVHQMLLNLLENATRHATEGGRVEVRTVCEGPLLRISVRDTGSGVPEADWERVFERFVRLDSAIGDGGGGLGLSLARWVAELHGGTLRIVASGPQGTTFEAALPIVTAFQPAPSPDDA